VAGVLLGFPALFPKVRRVADAVAIAWSAIAIYCGLSAPPLIVVALLFLCALAIERRVLRAYWLLTGTTVLAALYAASFYWTFDTVQFGQWHAMALLAVVGCLGLVRARRGVQWEPVAGLVCLVLLCAYGFCLNRELSTNRGLANVMPGWMREADEFRSQLRIG